jgi:hypothetical protein
MHGDAMAGLNLGDNWTPRTRNVLLALFAVYVAQLLLPGTLEAWLAWQPFGKGFLPWQPLTSFVLGGPTPLAACLEWLALFFLLAPVERGLGVRDAWVGILVAWGVAVTLSLGLAGLGVVGVPPGGYLGVAPLVAALVGFFGWSHPGARILLAFVIPVRADLVAWATGLLSFLYLLYARDLGSALAFGGWAGAWGWMRLGGTGALRRWGLLARRRRIERDLRKFEVIDGGRAGGGPRRTKPEEWVN